MTASSRQFAEFELAMEAATEKFTLGQPMALRDLHLAFLKSVIAYQQSKEINHDVATRISLYLHCITIHLIDEGGLSDKYEGVKHELRAHTGRLLGGCPSKADFESAIEVGLGVLLSLMINEAAD